ncbi:MerR family DNA-binding transcriptional regulator [Candidatus Dojkabacteria bacterium]|jgi:DNA-binding transcriptional MerR regulator|nr:MerR family DNA-binding transcriptional regulator [Candidatus Dojkabacteria bacterium]
MEIIKNLYKYGTADVCKLLGISRTTLITWEKRGRFTAPRNMAGYRIFTKNQLKQISKAFSPGGKREWHFL